MILATRWLRYLLAASATALLDHRRHTGCAEEGQVDSEVGGTATRAFQNTRARLPCWNMFLALSNRPHYRGAAMNRSIVFATMALIGALLTACSSMDSMMGGGGSGSLTSMLTKQTGVSEPQAPGGTGAMFEAAQQKLTAGDFDQVAKAIPGADNISLRRNSCSAQPTSMTRPGCRAPSPSSA